MPSFVEAVKQVWGEFLDEGPENLKVILDEYAGKIAAAAICDGRRWPKYSHADVTGEAERLQGWLEGSIEWLKTQWGSDAAVETIESTDPLLSLSIRIEGHNLIIELPTGFPLPSDSFHLASTHSPSICQIPLTSIDGTTRLLTLRPGTNTISLPSGFYIIAHRKLHIP